MPKVFRKPNRQFNKKKTLGRTLKYLFSSYPVHIILILISIIVIAVGSISASIFMQKVIDDVIYKGIEVNSWAYVKGELKKLILTLGSIYLASIICSFLQAQLLAEMTQGFLYKLRMRLFSKMEKLPISYFDRHPHGDIMSTYTNDVDAIRQLISVSIPQTISTLLTVTMLFVMMCYYSL